MPRIPKVQLTNLKLNEFSTVDAGDNPEAHIVLTKRQEEEDDVPQTKSLFAKIVSAIKGEHPREPRTFNEILGSADFQKATKEYMGRTTGQILAQDELRSGMWKVQNALTESVQEILMFAQPEDMASKLSDSVKEFGDHIEMLMGDLRKRDSASASKIASILDQMSAAVSTEGEMPAEKLASFEDALASLEKIELPAAVEETRKENKMPQPNFNEVLAKLDPSEADTIKTHLDEAVKSAVASALEEAKKSVDDDDGDVLKGLTPEARAVVAKARKDAADAVAKAEKLESANKRSSMVAKARKMDAGVDVEKMADVLELIDVADTEKAQSAETVITALIEQAKKGRELLTQTKGRTVVETEASKSIETMAKELQSKDPSMTFQKAYAAVLKANPAMYDEYREEVDAAA